MATLGELQTSIAARVLDVNNTAVSLAQITSALNDAIRTWKLERYWFNTKTDNVTLTTDSAVLTPPSDFLIELPKSGFTIDYGNTKWPLMKISPLEYSESDNQSNGLPRVYEWVGGIYSVYYIPDQDYTVICRYIKDYDNLVNTSDTNDFTVNATDLITYDALAKLHGELRQDEKMESYYSARAENEHKLLTKFTSKNTGSGRLSVETIL
jgi:hypothetical protein